ncbi:MAG: cell envelope integrity protein TolA [Oceanisphaera sp.]|uniref:cell envelope integrity protein TolA n=1 Tax=Oceanisphaera sp. TaxID=1929979 RepID=UPI003C73BAD8
MTEQSGIKKAVIISLALHLLVGVILLVGVDFKAPKRPTQSVSIIEATMIDDGMVAQQAKRLADMRAEQEQAAAKEQAQAEAEQQAAAAAKQQAAKQEQAKEAARVAEQQQALAAEKSQAQAEQKKVAEQRQAEANAKAAAEAAVKEKIAAEAKALAAKQQAEADAKALAAKKVADAKAAEAKKAEDAKKVADAKAAAAKKAEDAKKVADAKAAAAKKAEDAKKVADAKAAAAKKAEDAKKVADAKAAAAKKAAASEQALKDLEAMMGDDLGKSTAVKKPSKGDIDQAVAAIQAAVIRNWSVSNLMLGKQCVINVRLAADGLVLKSTVISGDQAVCQSALVAINKASPLPMPKDPELIKELQNSNLTLIPRL